MLYRFLADVLVLLHLSFVAFVVLGGMLVVHRPRWAWVHLPVAAWGSLVELSGWICPLTPLEVRLRIMGGEAGYPGGFVEHYVLPLLYPVALTRGHQVGLGVGVAVVNLALYAWALSRVRKARRERGRFSP